MRLIDIEPFEGLSPTMHFSYIAEDGSRHTVAVPVQDIPVYGENAAMPERLLKAVRYAEGLPAAGRRKADAVNPSINAKLTIEELDLSVRSYNCLMRAGIHTVGELLERSEADLIHIRNMGRISVKEIMEKLNCLGYHLPE